MQTAAPRQARMTGRAALAAALLALCCTVAVLCEYAARYPSLSEKNNYESAGVTLNAGNAGDGYVMIAKKSQKRLKVRVTKDGVQYTYDLDNDGEYDVFPLQMGSGSYAFAVYEQTSGTKYNRIFSKSLRITLADENSAFLYPNRYAWYTANSAAVQKAAALCEGLESEGEKLAAIRSFITRNIQYDYIKALSVKTTYVPDVDDTLSTGLGICFDYAALAAAMLRSQGVYTRLVVGYGDSTRHAWNQVLVDGVWQSVDMTVESSGLKIAVYTEELYY